MPAERRRRGGWPGLCLVVALPLLLLFNVPALGVPPGGSESPTPQQREAELAELRSRIQRLQAGMAEKQGQRSELSGRLQESERQIGRVARGLRVLRGRLDRQQARLDDLRRSEARQETALAREKAYLEQQVQAAYAMGRQEQLKILLNQEDPGEVSRILAYFDYLNRERVRRMGLIRDQLEELEEIRGEILSEQRRLTHLEQERQQQKQVLEAEQTSRRALLQQLAAEIQNQDMRLSRLRNDERQLSGLLQGLRDALADIPARQEQLPFARARGKLQWPVRGEIRHTFGDPKIGKLRWDGVMIGAPEGREVRAVYAGRVVFADWLRGLGLLLIIDHGDGYMTLYGHNQSLFKEAGEWVEAGEPVAAAGSTGGRKENGVYFAIRRHGKAVDPVKWIRRSGGRSVG